MRQVIGKLRRPTSASGGRGKSRAIHSTAVRLAGQIGDRAVRWARRHRDQIAACYYTKRGARHMIFIVPASGRFDAQLSSESAVLDADVVRAFPGVQFESLQVPPGHDVSRMKLIYGERN